MAVIGFEIDQVMNIPIRDSNNNINRQGKSDLGAFPSSKKRCIYYLVVKNWRVLLQHRPNRQCDRNRIESFQQHFPIGAEASGSVIQKAA